MDLSHYLFYQFVNFFHLFAKMFFDIQANLTKMCSFYFFVQINAFDES